MNSKTLSFSCIALYIQFDWSSFKLKLKGENKTGAKFSLYTVGKQSPVCTYIEQNISTDPELSKVSAITKTLECRVKQVGGEGGHHTAEEDLPGQRRGPERRNLLHGEQEAPHGGTEG